MRAERASDAVRVSASSRCGGSLRPRLAARRSTPAHTFGESQNLLGNPESSSSIDGKKHSTAALGDSEVASVEHSPRPPEPPVIQRGEQLSEVASSAHGKQAWDVLSDQPPGAPLLR